MKEFVEILTDYEDEDGNQHIDCFTTGDADEGGVCAGYVTPDGKFVRGEHISDKQLNQEFVQETIKEVIEEKLSQKQQLIERVLTEIKSDVQSGDLTAVEELLKFTPFENLAAYLPEE